MSTAPAVSTKSPVDLPFDDLSASSEAKSVLIQNQIEIPLGITSLQDFRHWARSESFPEQGRIDFVGGRIEVDLMIDNLFYHGSPKTEVQGTVWLRNREDKLGRLFSDVTRVSNHAANLSAEPDVVFLTFDSIQSGRVKYVLSRDDDPESFVEIEGSPDWVCEIISDSSEEKDRVRLADRYFAAGVREYWLVDARGAELTFQILSRGDKAFIPVEADPEGYQTSDVFRHRYHFDRDRGPDGHWVYQLNERPVNAA